MARVITENTEKSDVRVITSLSEKFNSVNDSSKKAVPIKKISSITRNETYLQIGLILKIT
jgi:hypothetical protein